MKIEGVYFFDHFWWWTDRLEQMRGDADGNGLASQEEAGKLREESFTKPQ